MENNEQDLETKTVNFEEKFTVNSDEDVFDDSVESTHENFENFLAE